MRGSARAKCWWPRPTSPTGRSAIFCPWSRSSPTSTASTWITTEPRRRCARLFSISPTRSLLRRGRGVRGQSDRRWAAARAGQAAHHLRPCPRATTAARSCRRTPKARACAFPCGARLRGESWCACRAFTMRKMRWPRCAWPTCSTFPFTRCEALGRIRRRGSPFLGAWRGGGHLVVDDYGHHPTEIAATIAAAKLFGRRLVVAFQPHRYSRTKDLMAIRARAVRRGRRSC
jgi:hypothetical protein